MYSTSFNPSSEATRQPHAGGENATGTGQTTPTLLELRLQLMSPTNRVMAEPKIQDAPAQTQFTEARSASPERKAARLFPFKYYIHDSVPSCRLQLFGDFTEAEVPDLQGCWATVRTTLGNRELILDVCELKSADEVAKRWLIEMAAEGATFRPESYLRNGLAGEGCAESAPAARAGLWTRVLSLIRGSSAVQA